MTESSTNLNWAASDKLKDSANYSTWKNLVEQALINASVYQYAIGEGDGKEPTAKDTVYSETTEYGKWMKGNAKAYIILHQTCGSEAIRTLKSTDNASTAWKLLKNQYEVKGFFLMDQCLSEFEALSYEKSRDIASFTALFKDLKARMDDAGLKMPATYYIFKYLRWVGPAFPTWAARQRSSLRETYTAKDMPKDAKLEAMMADLIDENRAVTMLEENRTYMSMYRNRRRPQHRKNKSNA
jgi:hypothetical protein